MLAARLKLLEERTRYEPGEVERRVFARWEESGTFHAEPAGDAADNYSIAVPPPNVTGSLHMGHALNASIQDVCIRIARMGGRRTKWIYGTDHAGIATQRQVERALEEEGTSREEIGREAFVERVWEWRRLHGSTITNQFRRIGASLDYDDERFTMDDAYVRAVMRVFVRLHERGLIHRDNYMVNWDPGLGTAISDLEVEQRTVEDTLYLVDYPLESGSGAVTVATVRPETMLADTAIAVNPNDERYSRLIGETAVLPLVGRRLPIISDDYVDPEFGTGALKITPGHDPADFEIGRAHGLDEVSVIGEDGRVTDAAPERFRGMDADDARRAVVAALREQDLISGTQPWVHDVPHSHRSGRRIEPLISLQWFCDMTELAQPAIEVVRDGLIRFHPERPWTGVYLDWLENIRPWCISRQLWWGHQLPVWYRGDEVHVAETPPRGDGWERDPDVLDTWFSSGLWPFATLGWPEETPELRAFYPTDVLSTGRDIIFLWVARMVMLGIEFTGHIPFTDVNIHSIIQAPDGRRMSKSLGTGIDPSDVIDGGPRPPVYKEGGDFPAYGADALRFGLLAMSSSQDVRFNEERVKQGRDLANKLWNASRLILLRASAVEPEPGAAAAVEDRWIVSRLERLTARVTELYDDFRFSPAALELYGAFWSELCDWYLELAKPRLYEEDNAAVSGVLLWALERTLQLLHPVMPFVTEEIWSFIPGEGRLLAIAPWPRADESRFDPDAEEEIARLTEAVTALRRYRDDVGAKASVPARGRLMAAGYERLRDGLARLARFELVDDASPDGDVLASVPIPGGAMQVLPSAAFDPKEARARIAARREQLAKEIERAERKLANQQFVTKAPPAVVEEERRKLEEYREALRRLTG
ncbi:MAG TPA: valine--tRNA ligase [Thermoleophilaceae bacterium]|nr:valine--tRNA ligase [Thermoleophilaceae bacterium]